MSENKLKSKDTIDAELKKIKAELAIAKHREAKLRNQIKGMTENSLWFFPFLQQPFQFLVFPVCQQVA